LAAFYRGDPDRVSSRELDVGLWWRDEPGEPLHRAAWICDTGELYLVRLGPPADGGGAVELLAVVPAVEQVERLLEGWRERCGEPGSLAWLRERVALDAGLSRAARAESGAGRRRAAAPIRLLSPRTGAIAGESRGRARVIPT
jgi:hypothetical protein